MRGGRVLTSTLYCVFMRLQHRAQVQVAQAADRPSRASCASWSIRKVGSSRGDLVQRVRDLLLVAALLRLDREAVHRRRELERHACGCGPRRASRAARCRSAISSTLATAAMSPGTASVDLDVVLALQHEEVADLERLAAVADEELGVLGDRALVDAEDAELARRRDRSRTLKTCASTCFFGSGASANSCARLAFALVEERRIALGRVAAAA